MPGARHINIGNGRAGKRQRQAWITSTGNRRSGRQRCAPHGGGQKGNRTACTALAGAARGTFVNAAADGRG